MSAEPIPEPAETGLPVEPDRPDPNWNAWSATLWPKVKPADPAIEEKLHPGRWFELDPDAPDSVKMRRVVVLPAVSAGFSLESSKKIEFALQLAQYGLDEEVSEDMTDALLDIEPTDIDPLVLALMKIQQTLLAVGAHSRLSRVLDRKAIGG